MQLFEGVAAFPITPADAAGRVDTAALARLLGRLREAAVHSIGLLGSTGTYAYLNRKERRRAIAAAVEVVGGRVPLIVGVGALRTEDAVHLARDAAAAGADGLLLAPVSYTPLTDEEVFQHFAAVAVATGLPICIYNNPGTTHFSVGNDLVVRLAGLPRVVALKTPAPAPVDDLRSRLPEGFAIGYSGDWHAAAAVLAGGVAWYSVVGGLLPRHALALMRAARAGDVLEVRRLDAELEPLWGLFRQHGSLRVVYAAANLMGLTDAQPPRPILPLDRAAQARIGRVLADLGV